MKNFLFSLMNKIKIVMSILGVPISFCETADGCWQLWFYLVWESTSSISNCFCLWHAYKEDNKNSGKSTFLKSEKGDEIISVSRLSPTTIWTWGVNLSVINFILIMCLGVIFVNTLYFHFILICCSLKDYFIQMLDWILQ